MPAPDLPFHTINAFAPSPHGGNQAAVVIIPADDPRSTDEQYMQTIAADFNLSETAFLVPLAAADGVAAPRYGLRWFTPTEEVPLCGHATFAAAFTLFNYVHPAATALRFQTRWRGELGATAESARAQGGQVGLSLPISETRPAPAEWTAIVAEAAGLEPAQVVAVHAHDFGRPSAVVQIADGVDLANLQVVPGKLLPTFDCVVIYTQLVPSESTADVVVINDRVFAPGLGIDEDPVTGSAWATLAGYYLLGPGAASVAAATGAASGAVAGLTIDARQLSARRGALTLTVKDGRALLVGKGWRTGYGTLESFE